MIFLESTEYYFKLTTNLISKSTDHFSPTKGPDAHYQNVTTGFQEYHHKKPFHLKYNDGLLPEHTIAYETFGELNEDKSNVVILFTGLSASSHARSHKVSQKLNLWHWQGEWIWCHARDKRHTMIFFFIYLNLFYS